MSEIAILTEEVANELIKRGFELRGHEYGDYTEVWYFKDGIAIERAVNEILKNLTEKNFFGII